MKHSAIGKYLFISIIPIFLIACGGGGGGGSASYIAPSLVSTTYSGNQQTKNYSDGSNVVNTAASSTASYAGDHTTRTTIYSYSDGGSNSVVDTVSPTTSPTYVGNTQTIVTTYGDGYTTTANNTATGSSISWASDHITRTTTYTFANGGTNPVVETVNPTISTPALTAANYPANWTTVGTVTAPSVSSVASTYGDGYVSTTQDGTSSKPFLQTTLSTQSIADPSAYVSSSTTTYNLSWGTPDKNGPGYANLFPSASTRLSSNLSYMGVTVSGQGVTGPTLVQPSTDVLAAWNAGWTGNGINLMTIDDYSSVGSCNSASTCHGITTMMISDLVAPGATKYSLDWNLTTNGKNISGTSLTTLTQMSVVNMSFGANQAYSNNLIAGLQQTDSGLKIGAALAVLVKSAGNNSGQDTYSYTGGGDYLVKSLVDNANTAARLLIVGALNKNGSVASPATIASYSNYAGSTTAASDRFVVANGNAPYAAGGVAINGSNINGYNSSPANYGTSYAAPVVAGYAAVIMQKFPNLTAASTSNIILDTARTDTLSCSPSCNSAIYGKGEASLSRALAPVGRLR